MTSKEVFGAVDYSVFVAVLVISAAIGIWYAYADRKKSSTQEFLMGGRSLSIFPVALSILSSFISAISLLGTPSEIYRYGTQYTVKILGLCFMIPTTAYLYLPVYHSLGLTSAYEYLERRFHGAVRRMASAVFIIQMVVYMSVVLYAPALALSEVTGLQLSTSVLSIGLVCTFYTSIGGIKAVVWTDCFQTLLMYAAMIVVLTKGISNLGGFDVLWERSLQGKRIEFFRFDFDPTIRHTFWSLVLGGYVTWMATYAANQAMIQRYLTIRTLKGAQRCLWINLPALILLVALTSLSGLVIFAYYWKCDPIGSKIISKPDQVFPRFVMETLGSLPGVPGLFVSGIFSGSLSTVSSGVNSLAAVVLEDFIKGCITVKLTDVWATRISKILAIFFGFISIALVFVAQKLGGILQGAATGFISGLAISVWFGVGAFVTRPFSPQAPMSYTDCTDTFYNATSIGLTDIKLVLPDIDYINRDIFYPYKLSYMYLSLVGLIVVLVVGNCVSVLTGPSKNTDKRLLSPLVMWLGKLFSVIKSRTLSLKKKKELSPPTVLSLTKMESHR